MAKRFLLALLFLASCQKGSEGPCTQLDGWEMTMPYRITIGKQLSPREKGEVYHILETTFQEVDTLFNNWNPQSEVSRLNAAPAHTPIPLSPPLLQLLQFCQRIVSLSSGRFDPAMSPLIEVWRASLKEQKIPAPQTLKSATAASGWHHLTFQKNTVTKDHPATTLDLCSIAKGLCIDWIIERLQAAGYPDLFVEWAGEIRTAGSHPEGRPWTIQIDPGLLLDGHPITPLTLNNSAIATSGDANQKGWILAPQFSPDGLLHRFFHILDPLTAQPLEKTDYSVASVSVIAPTCLLADALATAAMIFPNRRDAETWAHEIATLYPDVSFWILCYDPSRKR